VAARSDRRAGLRGRRHPSLTHRGVTTPATAFQICWDTWWGKGIDPSGLQDPLCSQGEPSATDPQTKNAACAVKMARKVTNAMLQ